MPSWILRRLVLPSLLLSSACFREPGHDSGSLRLDAAIPPSLQVEDLAGALYAPASAPRTPKLTLSFGMGVVPTGSLLLAAGSFSGALVAGLSPARRRMLESEALPLEISRTRSSVIAVPTDPLLPGARYSVIWAAEEASAAFPLLVSNSAVLGARVVASFPAAGQTHVPANLRRLLVQFDGELGGELDGQLVLEPELGDVLSVSLRRSSCRELGLGVGECVWLTPEAPLTPGARYTLRLRPGLTTLAGDRVPAWQASFSVSQEPDRRPPRLLPPRCALDERPVAALCVRSDDEQLVVRGLLDEPARVELVGASMHQLHHAAMLASAGEFTLVREASEALESALLRITDLAEQTGELALDLPLLDPLAPLSIEEVRSDPVGKEPAQEYVELLNWGPAPVSLRGYRLSTDPFAEGRAVLDDLDVAAGERVLIVGSDFDPHEASDRAVPPGVRVVRLVGALSLANAGTRVLLRDGQGRRVSAAYAHPVWLEGQCSVRRGATRRPGERSDFELDPSGGCTPGAASPEAP